MCYLRPGDRVLIHNIFQWESTGKLNIFCIKLFKVLMKKGLPTKSNKKMIAKQKPEYSIEVRWWDAMNCWKILIWINHITVRKNVFIPRLSRIKRVMKIENRGSLLILGQLPEKVEEKNKLESEKTVVHNSGKREKNVSKVRDQFNERGRENKRKGEVKSLVQQESNLKKYPVRWKIPQYTQNNKKFKLVKENQQTPHINKWSCYRMIYINILNILILQLNSQSLLPQDSALFAPVPTVAHCLLLLLSLKHDTITIEYLISPRLTTYNTIDSVCTSIIIKINRTVGSFLAFLELSMIHDLR